MPLSEREQRILDVFKNTLTEFKQGNIATETLKRHLNLVFERHEKNPNLQLAILNLLLEYALDYHNTNVYEFCKNKNNFADENWQMLIDYRQLETQPSQLVTQPGLTRFELLIGVLRPTHAQAEIAENQIIPMVA